MAHYTTATAGDASGSATRRRGMSIRVLSAGSALVLALLPICVKGQEEGEGDVAAEEGGGESNENASVAKAVEVSR